MSMVSTFLIALISFIVLQLWLIPKLENNWYANKSIKKVTSVGFVSILKALRSLLQIVVVVYFLVVIFFLIADYFFTNLNSIAILNSSIEKLEHLRQIISDVDKNILGRIVFYGALAGLVFTIYKTNRRSFQDSVAAVIEKEFNQLMTKAKSGALPEIPPTDEMLVLGHQLSQFEELIKSGEIESSDETKKCNLIIEELKTQYFEADIYRRMDLSLGKKREENSLRKVWPKIFNVFISKGFVRDSGRIKKLLSTVGMAILILSLLGVSAPLFKDRVDESVKSLWRLQVQSNLKQARESWEDIKRSNESEAQTTVASLSSQQINALAGVVSHSYMSFGTWSESGNLAKSESKLKTISVKDKILKKHVEKYSPISDNNRNILRKAPIHDNAEKFIKSASPRKFEGYIAREFETTLKSAPANLQQKIMSKLDAFKTSYTTPASVTDFTKEILGEILEPALKQTDGLFSNEYLKEIKKSVTGDVKKAVVDSLDLKLHKLFTELAGDKSVEAILSEMRTVKYSAHGITPSQRMSIRKFQADLDLIARRELKVLNNSQMRLVVEKHEINIDKIQRRSKAMLANISTNNGGEINNKVLDFLSQYEDYFSSDISSRKETLRSKTLARNKINLPKSQIEKAFHLSTNVKKLASSNLVGGIVIGNYASKVEYPLDITNIEWDNTAPSKVMIKLTNSDGKTFSLGPYKYDVVYRALIYAIDSRPLAVTILNTSIGSQKIYLNPALVDSFIGCELIELDRFIFSYLDPIQMESQKVEIQRFGAFHNLYELTQLYGLLGFVKEENDEAKRFYKIEIEHTLSSKKISLENAITDTEMYSNDNSFLNRNYLQYKPSVKRVIKSCVNIAKGKIDAYGKCVESISPERINSKSKLAEWLEPISELSVVSGIRDKSYTIDAKLQFLMGGSDIQSESTWPLSFLIQNAAPEGNESVLPWEYSSLTQSINNSIINLIREKPIAQEIMSNVRGFSVLQRMFRLAFAGDLGAKFPIEKFVAMSTELVVDDYVATPDWVQTGGSWGEEDLKLINELTNDLEFELVDDGINSAISQTKDYVERCANQMIKRNLKDMSSCSEFSISKLLVESCETDKNVEICKLVNFSNLVTKTSKNIEMSLLLSVPYQDKSIYDRSSPKQCRTI
jgi:hypothetical protein